MAKIEELKQLSILGVAESLGMELDRTGSHTYSWKEHDSFVINTRDNYFNWFSRSKGGDVFSMVQLIREEQTGQPISFKEAKHFLEEGNFEAVDLEKEVVREPFSYYLQPYETDFSEARQYLKQERQLSEETIDFFLEKGVLSQATKKSGDIFEPVIVFKSLDRQNEVVGASLQGIRENKELYSRGRLKQIMRASDGMTGMHVDIGYPKRLVFAEAPIDLMSYYELHKDSLQDVRFVAMDGLKESTVSRHVADLLFDMGDITQEVEVANYPTFLAHTSQVTNFLKDEKYIDLITLAVDNDQAGKTFVDRLESKKINLVMDLPPLSEGADKIDWNDYLKREKEKALNRSQELSNNIGGELFNRNSGYLEGKPSRTAPQPEELIQTQPDFSTNVHLHFNIERAVESSHSPRMRPIVDRDVRYLNRYAEDIQNSARWYKNEIANSKVTYFYQDQEDVKMLQVNFEKRHWMHLTGMAPVYAEHVISLSETFIDDIASGRGTYPNLTISNDFKDKIKLLPLLPEIFETDSFVFDDLTSVEKMGRLDVQKAIRSDDKDIMLAFRTDEESSFPATLLKPNTTLNIELDSLNQEKVILGVFIEKDNILRTLSVNNNFVKDDGKQMFEVVKQLQNREKGVKEMSTSSSEVDLDERIQKFQLRYSNSYPKEIVTSFVNFMKEGVEDEDIFILQQIFDSYDEKPTVNQFEKNIRDLFEEFKKIDLLFTTVTHADIPDNVYSYQAILELLSSLESHAEEGYIWTDESYFENQFQNPELLSKITTDYFESSNIDDLLQNKSVHVTMGDTTFMINSVDPKYNIYSMEELVKTISEELNSKSPDIVLHKLEELNHDFLATKEIINSKLSDLIKEHGEIKMSNNEEYSEAINIAVAQREEQERDSDGDGIPDEVERNLETNPYSADSDGDGKSDHEEVSFGSNPLQAEQSQPESKIPSEVSKTVSEMIQEKDSKGLSQLLKEGVKDYFKSDVYKEYLTALSKFHHYSPRNIQLILAQNPNASYVASFKKWKEDFDRSVNKGEKSIRIFAPVTVKQKDPETGKVLLDKEGKEKTKTFFKLVPVFDVSQTDGKELAKPIYDLEGTYQDYGNLYKSAKKVSEANGVAVEFADDLNGAHGTYSRQTNSISILKGMSEQQTLKTLFHEMAHSELHTLDKMIEQPLSRSTKELQAESVAFVVASHYGMDTSEYSFGYLATWSQDKEGLTDLEGQIKIVQKEADNLITKIDSVLEKYQSKEITKDGFQEKLARIKNKETKKVVKIEEKEQAKETSKKESKSDNEMSL